MPLCAEHLRKKFSESVPKVPYTLDYDIARKEKCAGKGCKNRGLYAVILDLGKPQWEKEAEDDEAFEALKQERGNE